MVWTFAYPAYIKFPGQEMPDFYPVFTLFNAWMGLVIFIFLGLSSKRFRFVLSRWRKQCGQKKKKKDEEATVPAPLVLPTGETVSESPSSSRPVSARTVMTEAGEPEEELEDAPPDEETPVEEITEENEEAEEEAPEENMDDDVGEEAPAEEEEEEAMGDVDNFHSLLGSLHSPSLRKSIPNS